jgi:LytS/YehU family sensor histidine kinase
VSRRAQLRATARLDAAQVRRSENERRMLQARLQALQAQIEPEFLQNTLARVRDRYESDPATAGTMLDRLIVYLRSALPQLRDSQSTLEREISLVSAYVAVIRASVDDTVVVAAEIPASLQDARMPPMVLLPLVECFLVHLRAQRTGAGTLRICAQASPARMRIEVFASGPAFSSRLAGTGLDVIRERLRALYGERGGLELARAGSRGVTATIEIPR